MSSISGKILQKRKSPDGKMIFKDKGISNELGI